MHVNDVLPRDAIPGIDDPSFGAEYFGDPDDRVLVVDDPPRAYPVRLLSYHEIVNDTLPGTDGGDTTRPMTVTWCPICASAVVYDRRVDGRTLTFGTSGKLADDALVMYDRETESEWKQPLGRAIAGPLAGIELAAVPATMTTWERFRESHPDGEVLQPVHEPGGRRGATLDEVYDMAPYDRYDAAEGFGLREMRGEGPERTWHRTDIDAKTVVLGVVQGDEAVGYPVPVVESAGGVVTDSVGGHDLVVTTLGGDIRAFEHPGFGFGARDGALFGDGTAWDPTTGRSDDGRRLSPIAARRLYAFAWQDDHGPDSFHELD
jgi:hypothetical protein